jgi:hypothetical protein
MLLELAYRGHTAPDCHVYDTGHRWRFRQADFPPDAPDAGIRHAAVPAFCDWLRRVDHFLTYWQQGARSLCPRAPLSALIPELRDQFGLHPQVRLSLEGDPGDDWGPFVAVAYQGLGVTARFDADEIWLALAVLEGHMMRQALARFAGRFREQRRGAREHRENPSGSPPHAGIPAGPHGEATEGSRPDEGDVSSRPLGSIQWSTRIRGVFHLAGFKTVGDVLARMPTDLLALKNFGLTSYHEVCRTLEEAGVGLPARWRVPLPRELKRAAGH